MCVCMCVCACVRARVLYVRAFVCARVRACVCAIFLIRFRLTAFCNVDTGTFQNDDRCFQNLHVGFLSL